MKFQVRIAGESRSVELTRGSNGWECSLEGEARRLDVVEVSPGIFSLLLEGESFTIYLERFDDRYRLHTRETDLTVEVANPRRWVGRSRAGLGRSGRQEITAPMPGRVVRVLVAEKQEVEEGQGVVVVEAMKMQNEIPAPKQGIVERVRVKEGDTVEHGEVLVVVA